MDDLPANNFPRRNSLLSSVAQQHWERASSLLPLDVGWAEGHWFWWILARGVVKGRCNYTEHNRPSWQNLAFKALAKELFFWSLLCHTGFETSSLNIPTHRNGSTAKGKLVIVGMPPFLGGKAQRFSQFSRFVPAAGCERPRFYGVSWSAPNAPWMPGKDVICWPRFHLPVQANIISALEARASSYIWCSGIWKSEAKLGLDNIDG